MPLTSEVRETRPPAAAAPAFGEPEGRAALEEEGREPAMVSPAADSGLLRPPSAAAAAAAMAGESRAAPSAAPAAAPAQPPAPAPGPGPGPGPTLEELEHQIRDCTLRCSTTE